MGIHAYSCLTELLNWNMLSLFFLGAVVYSHRFGLSPPRNAFFSHYFNYFSLIVV